MLCPPRNDSSIVRQFAIGVVTFALLLGALTPAASAQQPIKILPPQMELQGNFARGQLVVLRATAEGLTDDRSEDLTSAAKYVSSDPAVVSVDNTGRLLALADGQANIHVTVGPQSSEVAITVTGVVQDPTISYSHQIQPIISKAGCNMGACHATQHGKGGFKLSVVGYAPEQDYQAISRDRIQRRLNFIEPEKSLILLKPTLGVAHGGGRRLKTGSVDYQTIVQWIRSGAPAPVKDAPTVVALTVTPARRVGAIDMKQQLRVEAQYSDGQLRDVTALAKFDSMDEGVLSVSDKGLVRALGKGQAPIMIRFEGQAEISMFVVPYAETVELTNWKNNNFIDELAVAKFRELGVEPSPLCDEPTFLRRVYLDAIGTLPTTDETLAYLDSTDPDKREQLIDRLLGLTGDAQLDIHNDAYAAFWTLKWSDLIRNNSTKVGEQGMWALHNWIHESFRVNRPFDQFVRELVTAKGSIYMNGPANYFRINANSSELTESTAQLFLGVRLECAKCHHHPFEKFSQADYYGFASFFSRIGTKNSEEFGLFGRESVVIVRNSGDVRHPRSGALMKPTPLDGPSIDHPLDRRIPLAQWLTSPENQYFARSVANRYMSYLLGRGLVAPVDDMRSTNPPSNVAMLDALAKHFVENDFDLKQLLRVIMRSRLYQLDWRPTEANASDHRFYSHFKVKRLTAEPLLDAVDQVTGVRTKFKSLPLGTRAIELPDAEYPNYFLTTFAKPRRVSVCECERSPDANLAQALHTLNGDTLAKKIADKNGRVAQLLAEKKPHEEIVDQLYLAALSRHPRPDELEASHTFLQQSTSPKECYEDILWALLNSKLFLYVH